MIKCLLFDFDGVIAQSVDVKTEAFRQLFKNYPKHVGKIVKYHQNNGGISRFIKIKHIYKELLKEELTQEKFNSLCKRFSELVKEEVISAPYVKGVPNVLKACYKKYLMYVVSGTPENEIREIVLRRKLHKYFKNVFGAPKTKTEIIKKILIKERLDPTEVVFLGDSVNDLEAAKKTSVKFVAIPANGKDKWLKDRSIDGVLPNLCGFKSLLKKIEK